VVAEAGHRVSTGFAGTPFVTWALSETGHVEEAYRLLLEEGCPSWLYPVSMGATTIWERWDSMLPDGSINPGEMTSFNHYALGAVAGIVIAPLTLVSYDMGLALGLKGFVVAIMGSMVNAPAAVIGGVLLGVIESFASGLVSSGLKDALAYVVLFVVLLARTTSLPALFGIHRRMGTPRAATREGTAP